MLIVGRFAVIGAASAGVARVPMAKINERRTTHAPMEDA
jgi:hypothetical protein